jgi:uncharacterized protein (TIGR04255 family)
VIGIQFENLKALLTPYYGLFWDLVRGDYPDVEDRPPLAEVFEGGVAPGTGLEFLELPPPRRVWYVNPGGDFLIQLQPTRFLHNWRQVRPSDSYPTFVSAEERFLKCWATFKRFVADNRLGELKANQYELTYINHIVDEGGAFPLAMGKYVAALTWRRDRPAPFLPDPRTLTFDARFGLPEGTGSLFISAKHGKRRTDGMDVLILELTARGAAQADASDLRPWLAVAHEWIVRGFADVTSSEAHKAWERLR